MKKSILSLSAAVALGSLGFAGSANAWVASDPNGDATDLFLHNAGTGHQLFTPYYTANEGMATLVNIVNTDSVNGKAVKVRFRGATNSDDLLDFTLFLSPGDVWAGAVLQGPDGRAMLTTPDKSCTIPTADQWVGGVPFITTRLPSYVGTDNQAALTREGYVEVLNMADIPPPATGGTASPLYAATKHVSGVAPCLADTQLTGSVSYGALRNRLLSTTADVDGAREDGLANPTGGLMGSWSILDLGHMGTYSGTQTAVIATADTTVPPSGTVTTAAANLQFFPQIGVPVGADVTGWTADPLLTGTAPIVSPLWFDLPDMSTPLTAANAAAQADDLTAALSKDNVINEYIATAAGAAVPFTTDWVVSQPTRRYHVAVDYRSGFTEGSTAATNAVLVPRTGSTVASYASPNLRLQSTGFGPQACLPLAFSSTDREEFQVSTSASGGFSPGTPATTLNYCGEVFVAQFGATSALQASITNRRVTPNGQAGWASIGSAAGQLPMVGYAATLFNNEVNGNKYGLTFQHRWLAPADTGTP